MHTNTKDNIWRQLASDEMKFTDVDMPPTPITPSSGPPALACDDFALKSSGSRLDRASHPTPEVKDPLLDETGLDNTIRMLGKADEDGLFPSTASPVPQLRTLDPALISLPPTPTSPISPLRPADIPLPDSPLQSRSKPSLPQRRPQRWVSDISPSASPVAKQSRKSSARSPSGPSPLMIGGRQVSGVMQYAMRPPSRQASIEEGDTDDDRFSEGSENPLSLVARLGSPKDDAADWEAGSTQKGKGTDDEDVLALEGSGEEIGQITGQDQDEVWMAYVRQQLGALFPDFFQPDDEDNNDVHGAPVWPSRHQTEAADVVPAHEETLIDNASSPGMVVKMQGVPNVRSEISGLREEIERLRGVVGDLAEGLTANRPGVIAYAPDLAPSKQEPVEDEVTPAFLATATRSAGLIRTLHDLLRPAPEAISDEELFTETSLADLEEKIKASLPAR